MLRRRVESRAAGKRKRSRTRPTISSRALQVYFILAPVPDTLIVITISLQAVQNSAFQNRSLRVFDSQKEAQGYDVETNKRQLCMS